MCDLFSKNFEDVHFSEDIEREESILVEESYCFKKHKGEISLELLWRVATEEATDRKDNFKQKAEYHEEVYYAYYFLLSAFRNPKVCLLYTSPSPRDQRGSRMPSSA